jgi:GT2 family glycosyltransferase/glycosyltransferase involved in cell wall biosynthesis
LRELIKVAFASGADDLNAKLVDRMRDLYPELPLYVVSEFPPHEGRWIPYHVCRSFFENFARCRATVRGKQIRLVGVLLVPGVPYRRMRLIALLLSPAGFLAFNEHFGSFMLRPRCAGTILRHLVWRVKNFLRWQLNPGGPAYTFFWRVAHPRTLRLPLLYRRALISGSITAIGKALAISHAGAGEACLAPASAGISVVIPSRNGKELLQSLLPGLLDQLRDFSSEVIVVDNGSDDGTAEFLQACYPELRIEHSPEPLSFARAANRGINRARYARLLLINNDMVLQPGFFSPLLQAFQDVPELFCATAQILFPPGVRREETGKAVMAQTDATDFPIRCDLPIPGEDSSYVLYGSGGCSLYCTDKLRGLGGVSEIYEPAYVEDLDLGYRAWLRGWPTVFVAGAQVEHRHRATTARYFSPAELASMLEVNYLRFLTRAVASPSIFRRLWRAAIRRLYLRAMRGDGAALEGLTFAANPRRPPPAGGVAFPEDLLLALGSGSVAVFPGKARQGHPTILFVSPYLPFPLSHGGAVRMYNLMLRAAADFDQVLVGFSDQLNTPPAELLAICREIVVVRRAGSHSRPSTDRPEVVEEFDSPAFRAAVRQTVRKWKPKIAQLEFTQMAQYAGDCAPAKTILVEHDITFDLYEQLLRETGDWDTRRQLTRWQRFEIDAWRRVNCVVTMSEKDRKRVAAARAVCLPNGVDLERFRSSSREPDPARLLFIGSFAHLPNLMAVEYFLSKVWPLVQDTAPTLHIIAGAKHEYFLAHYQDRVRVKLDQPGIELEGFVADVRPAYERATVVIAPLVVSAGTNIKILEAMAMGKAIVSTQAGINGLDLSPGEDVLVADTAAEMAAAIQDLLRQPASRRRREFRARETVGVKYNWEAVADRQKELYQTLLER